LNPLEVAAKLSIISGAPGSRKDFVAGWLGRCNGFVDTYWRVDPIDGHSELVSGGDVFKDLLVQIKHKNIVIDALSDKTIALACHLDISTYTAFDQLVDSIPLDAVTLYYINCKEADMVQYHWDRIVKVFLKWGFVENDYKRQHYNTTVSNQFCVTETVTDQLAVNFIQHLIKNTQAPGQTLHNHHHAYAQYQQLIKCVELNYTELFRAGGSHYLCHMLNITATDRLHKYWDMLLPFVDAPDTCFAFGQEWSKSMITNLGD